MGGLLGKLTGGKNLAAVAIDLAVKSISICDECETADQERVDRIKKVLVEDFVPLITKHYAEKHSEKK